MKGTVTGFWYKSGFAGDWHCGSGVWVMNVAVIYRPRLDKLVAH